MEIERKFLIDKRVLKMLKKEKIPYKKKELEQYYTKISPHDNRRFRRADNHYFYTEKKGHGHNREEKEKEISKVDFEKNLQDKIGYLIKKKRYLFHLDGVLYELDLFAKPVDDLAFLEVEFESEEAYQNFRPHALLQPYIQKDVSDDFAYTNASLSRFGFAKKKIDDIRHPGKIEPNCSSYDVLRAVLWQYAKQITHYQKKMCEAYKEEDLHQFRINLRKSRALLTQMGSIFEEGMLDYHTKQLAVIAQSTNKKRDLDVFIDAFEGDFADDLHGELRYFYHDIKQQKEYEYRALKEFLTDRELEKYFTEWKNMLLQDRYKNPSADIPIALFLQERIERLLMLIAKKIKKYKKTKKEVHLHKVRISFKKLRYILESFEPLFYKKRVKDLLKRIKKLQNDLGSFNDLCVQHTFVLNYLEMHALKRENERIFNRFLTRLEAQKEAIKSKIEDDLKQGIDIEIIKKDVAIRSSMP